MSSFDEKVLDFLICPKTGSALLYDKKKKILHTNRNDHELSEKYKHS